MENNELRAFAEFLKSQEIQNKNSTYFNSFKDKSVASVTLFILSIIGFKSCGHLFI